MALLTSVETTVRLVGWRETPIIVRACAPFEDHPSDLADRIRFGDAYLYALERDGELQAWVAAQFQEGTRVHLGLFGRVQNAPGSVLSDARRLWEFVREHLAELRITEAALWIAQDNPDRVRLMRLYERLGFGQTGISMGRGIRSYEDG